VSAARTAAAPPPPPGRRPQHARARAAAWAGSSVRPPRGRRPGRSAPPSPARRRIAFALYAQFGPGKFPSNWWAVFYCVVCYVFVTLILNVFCYVKEGDAFLITHKKPVRRARLVVRQGLLQGLQRRGAGAPGPRLPAGTRAGAAAAAPPAAGAAAGALTGARRCCGCPRPQGFEFGIRVSSRLDRYSETYVLSMSSADKLQRE
jgi:hypothetical protein